jgi:glycosyltransferase involved in cell wall biosynthesis
MKKKILLVLPGIWSMGKNKGMPSVHQLVEVLQQRFNVTLLTPDVNVVKEDYSSVNVVYIKKFTSDSRSKYFQYFLARVNYLIACTYVLKHGFIKKSKYDLIYANYALPGAKILSVFFSIPLVIRIYGTFLHPILHSNIKKFLKYEELFLFITNADLYVITDDGTFGDLVAKYFGINHSKVLFLMNGVNGPSKVTMSRNDIYVPQNAKVFLTTSRLVNWKRVDRIVKAMLNSTSKNIFLIIAGDGPELCILKDLTNLDERILFLGAVDGLMVEKLFTISDWYITMHDVSNIGNPTLQALKSGLPVLTCSSGNTNELINEGNNNGICIEFNDEEQLVSKITEIINDISMDKITAQDYKEGVQKTARKLISWSERIELEIDAIEKLL